MRKLKVIATVLLALVLVLAMLALGEPARAWEDAQAAHSVVRAGSVQVADDAQPTPAVFSAALSGTVALTLSTGDYHSCAIVSGGMKCWGLNQEGEIGDGTQEDRLIAVDVNGLTSVTLQLALGFQHTCAVTGQKTVRCWGYNDNGQLGDGTTIQRSLPVTVSGLSNVIAVAAGSLHTCALIGNGTVKCWGFNDSGQVGDGTHIERHAPVTVTGLLSITAIAAGDYGTCALTNVGGVRCWGNGPLGTGTTMSSSTPVSVSGLLSGALALTAGNSFACALMNTGGVKCWGYNSYGQVGDGTRTSRLTPVNVSELPNAKTIEAGSNHICAVTTSGSLKCWGDNFYGQLGNGLSGSGMTQTVPLQVPGLGSGVSGVTAARAHTCALMNSGGIRCWGDNDYGALGNGSTAQSSTPMCVVDFVECLRVFLPLIRR